MIKLFRNQAIRAAAVAFALVGCSAGCWAYDFTEPNADGVTIAYNILENQQLQMVSNVAAYQVDTNYNISKVVVPDKVTHEGVEYTITALGDYVFWNCGNLKEVQLPNTVTTLGMGVFTYCKGLEKVNIPDKVTALPTDLFFYCTALKQFTIPEQVTSIGDKAFSYTGIRDIVIPSNVTMGMAAFANCDELMTVVIEPGIKSTEAYLFYQCKALRQITLPEGVTTIGYSSFYDSALEEINWPSTLTSITDGAFFGTNLTHVEFPEGLTKIGGQAFYNCASLTSITIPSSVMSIGYRTFWGCDNLMDVTSEITEPTAATGAGFGDATYAQATLRVPDGLADAYREAEGWKQFAHIVDATTSITGMADEHQVCVGHVYDLQGHCISTLRQGVNIVRMTDGSCKKILVK